HPWNVLYLFYIYVFEARLYAEAFVQFAFPFDDPRFPQIRDRLLARHGPQRDSERLDPNARFVEAMLSKCTRDALSRRAFLNVCASLTSWDDLANYSPLDILQLIPEVTHPERKCTELLAAVHAIIRERGHFDLRFLGS